jgi:hypothetical protein
MYLKKNRAGRRSLDLCGSRWVFGCLLFSDCEQVTGKFTSLHAIKANTYMVEWKYKPIRSWSCH